MTRVFVASVRIINIINMSSDGEEGPVVYGEDDSDNEGDRNSIMSARDSYNAASVT
jgi:hypothetical protein